MYFLHAGEPEAARDVILSKLKTWNWGGNAVMM